MGAWGSCGTHSGGMSPPNTLSELDPTDFTRHGLFVLGSRESNTKDYEPFSMFFSKGNCSVTVAGQRKTLLSARNESYLLLCPQVTSFLLRNTPDL